MKFKKSRYSIIVDELEDGRKLLFNTFNSSYGIMDNEAQHIFDNIEAMELDEDSLSNEKLAIMIKNGFLVPNKLDEYALVELGKYKSKFDHSTLSLTIAPTLECNMACPYCFEQNKKGTMTEEVQAALLIFVERYLNDAQCQLLDITWYGGEPLLAIEIIKRLSKQLISLCEEKGKQYSASIVTNGVLLTPEISDILVECKISRAQITIDGLPIYHDKRRVLKNGESSFDTIVRNIDQTKDQLRIVVRSNVDSGNIDGIPSFLEYCLNEKGWVDNPFVYLSLVQQFTESSYFNSNSPVGQDSISEYNGQVIDCATEIGEGITHSAMFPRRRCSFCHSSKEYSFVIDPSGLLYRCWDVIGIKEYAIGDLSYEGQITVEGLNWLWDSLDDKCKECSFLPLCMGGCPFAKRIKGENICAGIKESTLSNLKIAFKQYQSKKLENSKVV